MNSREWASAVKEKLEDHFGHSLVQVSSEQTFTAELDIGVGVNLTLLSSALAESPTYAILVTKEYQNGMKLSCTYEPRLRENINHGGEQNMLLCPQNILAFILIILLFWLSFIGAIDQNRIQHIALSNYKFWW